jgi:hypothetical protein
MTKWFKENRDTGEVCQRNYYEHIIRDDESLNRIGEYIRNNPMRWIFDKENPMATEMEPEDGSSDRIRSPAKRRTHAHSTTVERLERP